MEQLQNIFKGFPKKNSEKKGENSEKDKKIVDIEEVIRTRAKDPTDALFGRSPDNKIVHYPISIAPHFIVAGTTGSGKSVLINQVLVSMMTHAKPSELKLAIIDPKIVEFKNYKGLPYMLCDPVTDMSEANDLIIYLTILMDERYELMAEAGVKNIGEYNEWAEKNGVEKFTYIVSVVDEFADLMGQFKEVEAPVQRIGQKARASGIHMIIATQTPRADIITGKIKANFPSRVALMAANSTESMIVLDETGAERLRPKGDMYIKMNGGQLQRCQGGYISNKELDSIFTHLKDKYGECEPVDFKRVVAEKGTSSSKKSTGLGGLEKKMPTSSVAREIGKNTSNDNGMPRRTVQTELPTKNTSVSVPKDKMAEVERRRKEKRKSNEEKDGQKAIRERKERLEKEKLAETSKMGDMFDRKRQLNMEERGENQTDFKQPNQRKLDVLEDVFRKKQEIVKPDVKKNVKKQVKPIVKPVKKVNTQKVKPVKRVVRNK